MFIEFIKETQELQLKLPVELQEYYSELNQQLMQEFAFEAINNETLSAMERYVVKWFQDREINITGLNKE